MNENEAIFEWVAVALRLINFSCILVIKNKITPSAIIEKPMQSHNYIMFIYHSQFYFNILFEIFGIVNARQPLAINSIVGMTNV